MNLLKRSSPSNDPGFATGLSQAWLMAFREAKKNFNPWVTHELPDYYRLRMEHASVNAQENVATVLPESSIHWAATNADVDDYHQRHLQHAITIARAEYATVSQDATAVLWHTVIDRWYLREVADDLCRRVEHSHSMVRDEGSTIAHEYATGVLDWVSSRLMEHEYRRRIDDLRAMADEEGFTVAEASIGDFWVFYSILCPSQKAELVVNPNENLRAIWDDDHGNHIGIQFRGAGVYQYVIFKGPAESPKRKYDAGRGDIGVVRQRIRDFNLENLLGIYGE